MTVNIGVVEKQLVTALEQKFSGKISVFYKSDGHMASVRHNEKTYYVEENTYLGSGAIDLLERFIDSQEKIINEAMTTEKKLIVTYRDFSFDQTQGIFIASLGVTLCD